MGTSDGGGVVAESSGVDRIHFHIMRHTYATMLFMSSEELRLVTPDE
jgi:site-specific recombinase XerC